MSGSFATKASDSSLFAMNEREFELFRALVHQHTGIWLRDGKQTMLAARLSRRLRHHGLKSFAEYYDYFHKRADTRDEIVQIINCVTTNKTSFFRESHHFDFLAQTVVPEIKKASLQNGPRRIRIWSAACSTGEEPYTIAITLLEALSAASNGSSYGIEVVASDIDTAVLNVATRAIYAQDALNSVPQPLRRKYFLRGKDDMAGRVRVKPDVARLVQFRRINLMDSSWPLEDKFDAIFFRNALIYFKQDTQEMFLRRMVRYIKPRGYLFLGNSEHIPWLHDVVMPLNRTMFQLRE